VLIFFIFAWIFIVVYLLIMDREDKWANRLAERRIKKRQEWRWKTNHEWTDQIDEGIFDEDSTEGGYLKEVRSDEDSQEIDILGPDDTWNNFLSKKLLQSTGNKKVLVVIP